MNQPPVRFIARSPAAVHANQIRDYSVENRVRPSTPDLVNRTTQGTFISPRRQKRSKAAKPAIARWA